MVDLDRLLWVLGVLVPAWPAALVAALGILSLLDPTPGERLVTRLTQTAILAALLCAGGVLALMLYLGRAHVPITLGEWVELPGGGYHFVVKIVFDRLSVPFVLLTLVLSGLVGSFSIRYLHREPGFTRYFLLYALFVLGMVTAALGATIETLYVGWELVGLSSALLVGFFHERANPARGGLWVWCVYRVADAALLLAAFTLHQNNMGDLEEMLGGAKAEWPTGTPDVPTGVAFLVGLLLLGAAAGKSGLVPFSGWLPRAMEGPTSSSAVFYGALAVHLGAYLLLRMSPLLAVSTALSVLVIALGLVTAVYASLAGSVQTDIKSSLSFASLAQVGIIVAEIGLGLPWLALVHMIGHACLRTLQFLRAPNLMHDSRKLQNAIGGRPGAPTAAGLVPESWRGWVYRFGLERGWLDELLWDWVARPFVRLLGALDRLDRVWGALMGGGHDSGNGRGETR